VVTPGLWLQCLTTSQPNDEQLVVACAAMTALLNAERAAENEKTPVAAAVPAP
jgi:uncharacterized protein YqhQ